VIAFDTSALVKLVIAEADTGALRNWLVERPEEVRVASDLCRVEVLRAVARAEPAAVGTASELLAGLDLVPLARSILQHAAVLAPPSLRSLDAIHLATALLLGPELEAFVVYDDRLAAAAADAGLPVARPV
jgi:uncharacterized protein